MQYSYCGRKNVIMGCTLGPKRGPRARVLPAYPKSIHPYTEFYWSVNDHLCSSTFLTYISCGVDNLKYCHTENLKCRQKSCSVEYILDNSEQITTIFESKIASIRLGVIFLEIYSKVYPKS
jgi:hypothetical protein